MPAGSTDIGQDPSLTHVLARLRVLELRVGTAVQALRAADAGAGGRYRGIVLSLGEVESLLCGPLSRPRPGAADAEMVSREAEAAADAAEARGTRLRLRALQRVFGLDALELLVTAMAPDIDARYERLYAFLQNDVTRGRPTTGLALDLERATGQKLGKRQLEALTPV